MSPTENKYSKFEIETNDETWGQFIDIENGCLITKQFITETKSIKKPIMKVSFEKTFVTIRDHLSDKEKARDNDKEKASDKEKEKERDKEKDDDSELYCNEAFRKLIERQIYLGCLICILTIGLFIMP